MVENTDQAGHAKSPKPKWLTILWHHFSWMAKRKVLEWMIEFKDILLMYQFEVMNPYNFEL
jgi:hypothetical protein